MKHPILKLFIIGFMLLNSGCAVMSAALGGMGNGLASRHTTYNVPKQVHYQSDLVGGYNGDDGTHCTPDLVGGYICN